jgi:hypothetical protein
MRRHFWFEVLSPNLSFCRSLRSCDMDVLYHGSASSFRTGLVRLCHVARETDQAASLQKVFLKVFLNFFLNYYAQGRWQDVDGLALQCEDFAIHHYVDWGIELELDPPNGMALGQRMIGVRAVIKG